MYSVYISCVRRIGERKNNEGYRHKRERIRVLPQALFGWMRRDWGSHSLGWQGIFICLEHYQSCTWILCIWWGCFYKRQRGSLAFIIPHSPLRRVNGSDEHSGQNNEQIRNSHKKTIRPADHCLSGNAAKRPHGDEPRAESSKAQIIERVREP